jgi:hypothetical protein
MSLAKASSQQAAAGHARAVVGILVAGTPARSAADLASVNRNTPRYSIDSFVNYPRPSRP